MIDGPGFPALTVGDADSGVFLVDDGVTATLTGLTITGQAQIIDDASGDGGGISNAGTLTVDACAVVGSFAETNGGGIFNQGTLNFGRCIIMNKHPYPYDKAGGHGGGICNSGGRPSTRAWATAARSPTTSRGPYPDRTT